MPTSKGIFCPEWCVEVHTASTLNEDELTVHWKGFGSLPGQEASLVKIWGAYDQERIYSSGIEVEMLETYLADDLRSLSENCLEAASWMEVNFNPAKKTKKEVLQ